MPQIGSFTLLLALALAAYSFLAGALGAVSQGRSPGRNRAPRRHRLLGRRHRRRHGAGDGCAFGNDFSVAYILHHSNRDLPLAYKFAALWSGQEGSLLFWAWLLSTYALVLRLRYKRGSATFRVRFRHHRGGAGVLPAAGEFRRQSLRPGRRDNSRRRQRTEPAAAISRDGDPSADALPRLRRRDRAVRLRAGRADHEVSRREVDPHHPPLDHGGVGCS